MSDAEESVKILEKLKSLGVKLSVDDFGTGYSSFGYLSKFNADIIKIDRSFIEHVTTCYDSQTITMSIVSLAHNLSMKVVLPSYNVG